MIVVYRYDIQYIIVVYHNYYTHQNRWDPSGFFSHLLGPLLFVSCSAQWWGSWANHHPNHLQSRAAALAPPSSTAPGKKKSRFVNKKTCVNTKISFIFYIIEVWQYNNWCKHVQTSGIDAHMQRTVCTNVTARPYGLPRRLERCSNINYPSTCSITSTGPVFWYFSDEQPWTPNSKTHKTLNP